MAPSASPAAAPPAMASAPPPMASAPPAAFRLPVLALALLVPIALLLVIVAFFLRWPRLLFATQMLLLTTSVCLTPTLSYHLTRRWGRFARAILEILLLNVIVVSFYLWLWRSAGLVHWIIYPVTLILIVEAGGHLVEWNKVRTLRRLSTSKLFANIQSETEALERMFQYEKLLYLPLPLGLIAGTIWGLAKGLDPKESIHICVQLIFWGASLALLVFLVISFVRMADPLLDDRELPLPGGTSGRAGRKKFRLKASATTHEARKVLDLTMMVVDLRKVYLFDSSHSVILLVACAAIALGWGAENKILLLLVFVMATFVFNHLPYIIGQSRLHENVLKPYEGLQRAEINAKLKEHAPYFPKWEFLAVMLTSSPAGGAVYFLLEHTVNRVLGG
ncbi:MAG TPA: hypothetical protein VK582_11975 [Pyrinomonadaceae bacterium]|nr:hypothetical protein [Pyrinomonadaceae bacterium]